MQIFFKAACDGAVIQWYRPNDCWIDIPTADTAIHSMLSLPEYKYRIKPANTVWYRAIYKSSRSLSPVCQEFPSVSAAYRSSTDFLGIERITISPEGVLVSVEIVPESEWKA